MWDRRDCLFGYKDQYVTFLYTRHNGSREILEKSTKTANR